jgi:hypothetical protein
MLRLGKQQGPFLPTSEQSSRHTGGDHQTQRSHAVEYNARRAISMATVGFDGGRDANQWCTGLDAAVNIKGW